MTQPKISIITVCKNAEKTIEATMASVNGQTYPYIEHLVLDGNSTDSTVGLAKRLKQDFTNIVSENDRGIYDAMNKGIRLATGDILYFLNSGDSLYGNQTLAQIAREFRLDRQLMLVYGNIMVQSGQSSRLSKNNQVGTLSLIRNTICHQAIFAHKKLFVKYGDFNTDYRFAADYDWLLRVIKKNAIKKKYLDTVISNFNLYGVSASSANHSLALAEHYQIASHYFPRLLIAAGMMIDRSLQILSRIKRTILP